MRGTLARDAFLIVCLTASPALAAGFALPDQSAEAAGLAGAWVARADSAAAGWYNPAALARVSGTQVQLGAGLFRATGNTELSSGDPAWGLDPAAPAHFQASGEDVMAPHVYFSQSIGKRWGWGIAVNRPFGLSVAWKDRPVTYSAEKTELGTYAVHANAAVALGEPWSIGGGLTYLQADLDTFSREVRVNLDNDPDTIEATGRADLSASGSDVGFNVAVLYATRGFSAALTYRSAISPTLDGDLTFTGFGPAQALFPDSAAEVTLDLPSEAVGGVAWNAADAWEFELDVSWTQWSSFQSLPVDVQQETPPFVVDARQRQDWEDTIAYRIGVSWQFAEHHAARLGLLQDQGAIPEDTRRPALSDADRVGVAVGYGFTGAAWSVDAYLSTSFYSDGPANGDPGEGVLDGTYQSDALGIGATLTRRF
jgi:long-chain fatty acid transport protein